MREDRTEQEQNQTLLTGRSRHVGVSSLAVSVSSCRHRCCVHVDDSSLRWIRRVELCSIRRVECVSTADFRFLTFPFGHVFVRSRAPVSLRPLTYSLLHPTSTVEKDFSVIPFSILEHFLMKRLSQRPADGPCDAPCLRSILSHSRLFQECRPFPSFYQPGNRRHVQSFQESLSSFLEFSFRVYLRTVNAC